MCRVFVVMPFEDDLEGVYEGIEKCLKERGFDVQRADTQLTQGSVVRDIVVPLDTFDLVIADLTWLNPNVMYELGLAHALDTPVIMITQDIDDLPFDLGKYRAIEYSPLVGRNKFDRFIEDLSQRIDRIDRISFGSPVSDYLDHDPPEVSCKKEEDPGTDFGGETDSNSGPDPDEQGDTPPGFFDNVLEAQSGFEEVFSVFTDLTTGVERMGSRIVEAADMMEEANRGSGPDSLKTARVSARMAADALRGYRENIRESVTSLRDRWPEIDAAVAGMVEWYKEYTEANDEDKDRLREAVNDFDQAHTAAQSLLPTLVEMRDSIRGVYGLDRALNREVDATTLELNQLILLVTEIAETLARAREMDFGTQEAET